MNNFIPTEMFRIEDSMKALPTPKKKCCKDPDVKNEGWNRAKGKKYWEFYCYSCNKSWSEVE